MVGSGAGARAGVLIRNAAALEHAARIDTLVLDKTGTLTLGRPGVTDLVPLGRAMQTKYCASLRHSNRTLSIRSRARCWKTLRRPECMPHRPALSQRLPARALRARVDGKPALLGAPGFVAARDIPIDASRLTVLQREWERR
jgi:Cu+-exporting ATPase